MFLVIPFQLMVFYYAFLKQPLQLIYDHRMIQVQPQPTTRDLGFHTHVSPPMAPDQRAGLWIWV